MRYFFLDNIVFRRLDGKSYTIKDFREIPTYIKRKSIKVREGDFLDEIATRKDIYGDGAEQESYRIFEMNVRKLMEANFDVGKCKTLDIPELVQ